MTLETLLIRAEVRQYWRALYFAGCLYHAGVLTVPNRQLGETIARQFGPDLRRVVPDLRIVVGHPAPVAKAKPSAFKAGHEPVEQIRLRGTE